MSRTPRTVMVKGARDSSRNGSELEFNPLQKDRFLIDDALQAADCVHADTSGRCDNARGLSAAKVNRRAIVDGQSRSNRAFFQECVVRWPPLGFRRVVWAAASGKEAQTIERPQPVGERIG